MCGIGCSNWVFLDVYSLLLVSPVSFPCPTVDLLVSFVIRIGWNGTAVAAHGVSIMQRLVVISLQVNQFAASV